MESEHNKTELIKNQIYIVKIIDKNLYQYYGKITKLKFTGIMLRSLKTNDSLFIDQCEIIKKAD